MAVAFAPDGMTACRVGGCRCQSRIVRNEPVANCSPSGAKAMAVTMSRWASGGSATGADGRSGVESKPSDVPVPLSISSTRPPRAAATVRPSGLMATAGRPPAPACSGTQAMGAATGDAPAARPVSIQRSSTPSSSAVRDRAPTSLSGGGMKSSSRWAARRNSGLWAAFFEIAAGPESPPTVIAARLSSRSPPSDRWALWQAVQFAASSGAISAL